jgi:hypothetical protein
MQMRASATASMASSTSDEIDRPRDFVVMRNSLYHFFDARDQVLATLREAANGR